MSALVLHRVKLAEATVQPWKNGGGFTRELLTYPSPSNWQVRLSVAEVQTSGPFSRFEGVQRWFAVLSGAGVELAVDDKTTSLQAHDAPFEFDGGASTHCTLLKGATQDFNLMLSGVQGRMQRVDRALSKNINTMFLVAVYSIDTWTTVQFNLKDATLQPGELLWTVCEEPTALVLQSSNALLMQIQLGAKA